MIDITFKKLCECLRMPQGGCKARRLFEWNYSFFAQLFTSENGNIQCTGHVILCTCLFEHFYGISNPTTFSSVSMIFPHLQLIKVLRIWKKKKYDKLSGKKAFTAVFAYLFPFLFVVCLSLTHQLIMPFIVESRQRGSRRNCRHAVPRLFCALFLFHFFLCYWMTGQRRRLRDSWWLLYSETCASTIMIISSQLPHLPLIF